MASRRTWAVIAVVVIVIAAAFLIPMLAGHPPAPSISFSYTAKGMSYTFDALIFRYTAPVNYTWDFGDGQQAKGTSNSESNPTQFNVTHVYAVTGTYTVDLKIVDVNGNPGEASQSVVVTNYQPVSATLAAAIQGTAVTATVTISGGSPPYYVGFNFGDGVPVSTQKGNGPTIAFTHTYLATGTYTVQASVGDSTQTPAIFTNTQSVTATYTGLHATMDVAQSNLTVNATVTIQGGQSPYTVVFDWGDGSGVTRTSGAPAQHTYSKAGTYTINVSVYDMSLSPPAQLSKTVTVPPSAAFPIVQLLGLLLIGAAGILALAMWQYRRLRKFPAILVTILALAAGILLFAGVI